MQTFADVLGYVNLVAFVLLAGVTFVHWRRARTASTFWAFMPFGVLGMIAVVGEVLDRLPEDSTISDVVTPPLIAVLLLFPYFLFRFASSFVPAPKWLEVVGGGLTAAAVAMSFILPLPEEGEPRTDAAEIFVALILIQWTFLSAAVSVKFWRAGKDQPAIAHRRTRLLAIASGALAIAIVIAGAAPPEHDPALDALSSIAALASVLAFFAGVAPPRWLRGLWRLPLQERLRRAIIELMAADEESEVITELLPHTAAIVGGSGIALIDDAGEVVGTHDLDPASLPSLPPELLKGEEAVVELDRDLLLVRFKFGSLLARTSPYTPFFGREEIELLGTLGALANFAIGRVRSVHLKIQMSEEKFRRQQALEINDNVVQGLAVAKYAFDLGQHEKARSAVDKTLKAARSIISNLLEEIASDVDSASGALTRKEAASSPTRDVTS